jgi:integrase
LVDGRKWRLEFHGRSWRIRSRGKGRAVTQSLDVSNLADAKEAAKKWIAAAQEGRWTKKGKGSLEVLATVYLEIPKRVSTKATTTNVSRLRTVVRVALGKELSEVSAAAVGPDLWAAYYREALKKYDRKLDYTTRAAENARLNAAVRAARSMFLPKYAKPYAEHGIFLNADATKAALLPEPWLPRPEAKDVDLLDVWPTWRNSDPALWLAVGLARFAGLRRDEIWHCRRTWIEVRDGTVFVVLRDRPEEKWQTKTGRPYRALVLNAELAAFLSSAPAETVFFPEATEKWFVNYVCNAIRPFTGTANKPLHRLRGLYAEQLTRETEEAIIAKRAGIAAAQQGLGHTSSQTTEKHYLDALR